MRELDRRITGRRPRSARSPPAGTPWSARGTASRRLGQRLHPDADPGSSAATTVGVPKTEVAQCEVYRVVPLRADQHVHPRGADQSVAVHIPAGTVQHRATRRGQAAEVGHCRAGHETEVGVGRQPEYLEQPGRCHLLDRCGRRRREPQPGVLVPSADQPVRGQRSGQGGAHDPAEEAAGLDRHQTRLGGRGQQVDDLCRDRARARAAGRRTPPPVRRRPSAGATRRSSSDASQDRACSAARASAGSKSAVTASPSAYSCRKPPRVCGGALGDRTGVASQVGRLWTRQCGPSSVSGHRF